MEPPVSGGGNGDGPASPSVCGSYNAIVREETSLGGPAGRFPTTDWTRVIRAREESGKALEALLDDYWKPVYFFFRRKGLPVEDAKDAVQELYSSILERRALDAVDPARGRFRTFVRMVAQRSLADSNDRQGAAKRGGGRARVPIGTVDPPDVAVPPERGFIRDWADETLRRSLDLLRDKVPGPWFDVFLDHYATGDSYGQIAQRQGVSVSDVTNWIHQARLRLRDVLLVEVRRSVDSDGEVESEIRDLFEAFENSEKL